ncbi:MAG TPA: hypothetical protein VGM93_10300 [Acidimicrobiales bacterium]
MSFDVDGTPVRFEADGFPLSTRPEVAATAFAVPAAEQRARLAVAEPVDPAWRTGVGDALALMAPWWGAADTFELDAPDGAAPQPVGATGVGQCFTAGVDSFWSLLHGDRPLTHLVTVFGFDTDLGDHERIAQTTAAVTAVAEAKGLVPLFVRTDLRQHPHFAATSWEHTHGAALAAVGLALSGTIGTLVIPPSYAAHRLVPWGSRPDLDPLWSMPGTLVVSPEGAVLTRRQRIAAIAAEPLVHQHLQVCWEHIGPGANCGRCEKCLCTQTLFSATPHLADLDAFPDRDQLESRIDALGGLRPGLSVLWADVVDDLAPVTLQEAVQRLLRRSPA